MLRWWLPLAFAACEELPRVPIANETAFDEEGSGDTTPDNSDTTTEDSGTQTSGTLYVATSDLVTGDLSRLDPATGDADGGLLALPAEPRLAIDGERLVVLGGNSDDTIRTFSTFEESLWEATPGGAPWAALRCGEALFVSLHGGGSVVAYNSDDGTEIGRVDLSAFADEDGSSEPGDLLPFDETSLLVALQRLGVDGRSADGTGVLARIDCGTLSVVDSWPSGPAPRLFPDPSSIAFVVTGDATGTDGTLLLDGTVVRFQDGTLGEPLLEEATFGQNVAAIYATADGGSVLVGDNSVSWSAWCLDLETGNKSAAFAGNYWIPGGVADAEGGVWLAVREGYGEGETAQVGMTRVRPEGCVVEAPVATALQPFQVVVGG